MENLEKKLFTTLPMYLGNCFSDFGFSMPSSIGLLGGGPNINTSSLRFSDIYLIINQIYLDFKCQMSKKSCK